MHPAASWLLSLWKYSVRELRFDGGSLAGRPTESADEETEHQPPLEDSDMIAGPFPPVPLYVSLHHFSLKEAAREVATAK